jgi:hypothetical protein
MSSADERQSVDLQRDVLIAAGVEGRLRPLRQAITITDNP